MKNIKLFIFDIDHTITQGISIWEIMHKECGTWETHGKKYVEEFAQGKFDFDTFARLDVASWKNQPLSKLDKSISQVEIMPGFPELMQELHKRQIKTAIISCSIGQFANALAKKFGIDYVFANPVAIKDNLLDGIIDIQVEGDAKAKIAEDLIHKLKLNSEEVAVAGDSRFDLPMFDHAKHSFIIQNEKYKDKARYFVQDFREIINLL